MKEKEKMAYKEEGIIIPVQEHQIQLVKDIVSLSDKQFDALTRFVKLIKDNNKE